MHQYNIAILVLIKISLLKNVERVGMDLDLCIVHVLGRVA